MVARVRHAACAQRPTDVVSGFLGPPKRSAKAAAGPCSFRAGFAERPESFHIDNRVHRLRRSVRIATAPGYRGTAADAHAAPAERDAAGPFEVVAADDARDRDHVAF